MPYTKTVVFIILLVSDDLHFDRMSANGILSAIVIFRKSPVRDQTVFAGPRIFRPLIRVRMTVIRAAQILPLGSASRFFSS